MSRDFFLDVLCSTGSVSPELVGTLVAELSLGGFELESPHDGVISGIDGTGTGALAFGDAGSGVDWLGSNCGLLAAWGGPALSIEVSVRRLVGVLPAEMISLHDTPRFDVVRVAGRLRDLESNSPVMSRFWSAVPSFVGC